VVKARWGPVQVKITVQGRNYTLQAPSIDMVSPTTMTSGGYVLILGALRPRITRPRTLSALTGGALACQQWLCQPARRLAQFAFSGEVKIHAAALRLT
jgi:hypothetical protein